MILYTPDGEINTLEAAFLEARLLLETLTFLGPGFPNLPRNRGGTVQFNRNSDGSLESIFLKAEPVSGGKRP